MILNYSEAEEALRVAEKFPLSNEADTLVKAVREYVASKVETDEYWKRHRDYMHLIKRCDAIGMSGLRNLLEGN